MDLGKLLPRKKETPNYVKRKPDSLPPGLFWASPEKLGYNPFLSKKPPEIKLTSFRLFSIHEKTYWIEINPNKQFDSDTYKILDSNCCLPGSIISGFAIRINWEKA